MLEELKSIANLKTELDNLTKHIVELHKGTQSTKELSKCSERVDAKATATIELLCYRYGAFKPIEIQMIGLTEDGKEIHFEILDVRVMGAPQLLNYNGITVSSDRGLSSFYKEPQTIDWQAFGPSAGQGLQITVKNLSNHYGTLYVKVKGIVFSEKDNMLGKI